MLIGIVMVGLIVYLFLRLGPGASGAINRIFGLLILAIAVQRVWGGVVDFKRWSTRSSGRIRPLSGFTP